MNHIASMLSPRFKAMPASANVPSAITAIQTISETGCGSRCVSVLAIATDPPSSLIVRAAA
jgi:hypothetical protein